LQQFKFNGHTEVIFRDEIKFLRNQRMKLQQKKFNELGDHLQMSKFSNTIKISSISKIREIQFNC